MTGPSSTSQFPSSLATPVPCSTFQGRTLPPVVEKLSFARTQIGAHGVEVGDRPVIVCQNFVVDGGAMQPLSEPRADAYLGFLGLGASAEGDVVLSLRTLPGLIDAYRRMGMLHPSTEVFEVNPILNETVTGYPNSSPLECLSFCGNSRASFAAQFTAKERPLFVGTFLTERMRTLIGDLGCEAVQLADPSRTNNKYLFGKMSAAYGFSVMPQVIIDNEDSFISAATLARSGLAQRIERGDRFGDTVAVAWLKLAGGSGGDFVQKIEISRTDALGANQESAILQSITEAYTRLRQSAADAFVRNDYGEGALDKFWPPHYIGPVGSAVIVEQDARVRGAVRVNASNLMVINKDGSWSVEGYFQQITGEDGDYRGSMPFSPERAFSTAFMEKLDANMAGIAAYARDLNLYGYIGVDFFITENAEGEFEPVMTEMNGRIPISGAAKIIADKLNAPAWINVNLALPNPVSNYSDFEAQLGELARFSPGDFSQCRVVPQAFRTMYDGESIVPSNQLKALIVGPTQEACLELLASLNQSGFGK